ncbi:MAG: LicD family protein, partial [Erysipelotrichaceae bacterium]|nr:LicD family protein [Erysipelotrichaceae bacterium]
MKYVLKVNEDGSEIYVHDVHKVLLKMLEDIDAICKKHHIPYFLNGGSALGAIRHKGFIPWDDDADIAMMHEDYVKFIDVLKQDLSSEYIFQCFDTHKEYNVL